MGMNDFEANRRMVATPGTAGAGEASVALFGGLLTGMKIITSLKMQNLHATDPMDVGFYSGGPYARVKAGDTLDLGAVGPGDRSTLFFIRAGASDVPFRMLIWT